MQSKQWVSEFLESAQFGYLSLWRNILDAWKDRRWDEATNKINALSRYQLAQLAIVAVQDNQARILILLLSRINDAPY